MPNTGPLQVVQLDDVVETVCLLVQPAAPARIALELVGPERLSLAHVIAIYRDWMGWPRARASTLPQAFADLLYTFGDGAGRLGWRPPMRSTGQKEIARGRRR